MATYTESQWMVANRAKKSRNVYFLIPNMRRADSKISKRKIYQRCNTIWSGKVKWFLYSSIQAYNKYIISDSYWFYYTQMKRKENEHHIFYFLFLLPCEPQYCQTDLRHVPSSDWPAPSRSWLHQRTSQSAAEEAPQCPVLTAPRSIQVTRPVKGSNSQ